MEKTIYIHNGEEIKLTCDNMWYVQLDATIRFVFLKYGVGLPPFVIVNEMLHHTDIIILRRDISTIEEAINWNDSRVFIYDELKQQANSNSSSQEDGENWVKYKIKII